jgi:signal transduction histidine kinase
MREAPEWIHATLVVRCGAEQALCANAALEEALHNIIAESAKHGLLVVASDTEPRLADGTVGSITPHTPLSHEAQSRVDELVSANRRKDEFLAILGHELRTPLAAIHHAIHLLNSQSVEPHSRERMQALIERQVHRMTQLVDDLLDLSRITHGRLSLQRERLDLRTVVSDAIETLEPQIRERQQWLTTSSPDAPVFVHADSRRLEQVFINLLGNASRYTDAGGELSMRMYTQNGQAGVAIRDTGIGIAPEVVPRIFDLFTQADATSRRSEAGLGVGLALVRSLVELHGGSVTAASAGLGRGSEFIVCLPMAAGS